jgi:hypothetical protein
MLQGRSIDLDADRAVIARGGEATQEAGQVDDALPGQQAAVVANGRARQVRRMSIWA